MRWDMCVAGEPKKHNYIGNVTKHPGLIMLLLHVPFAYSNWVVTI